MSLSSVLFILVTREGEKMEAKFAMRHDSIPRMATLLMKIDIADYQQSKSVDSLSY